MAEDKEKISTYLAARFPSDVKHGTSGVVHSALGEKIKRCLHDPSSVTVNKNFRIKVKKCSFQLMSTRTLGIKDVLVVPIKSDKEVGRILDS